MVLSFPLSSLTTRPAERRWGSLGGWNTKPWGHQSGSLPRSQSRSPSSSAGADWAYPAPQPPIIARRTASASTTGSSPIVKDTRSIFTNTYPRYCKEFPHVIDGTSQNGGIFVVHCRTCHHCSSFPWTRRGSSCACGTLQGRSRTSVHSSSPFQEYEFSLRIVTPSGSTLLTMPGLLLPPLPDIEDYVPPPFTEVVKVGTAKCCRPWKT